MRELPMLVGTAVVGSALLLWLLGRDWWTRRRLLRHVDRSAAPHGPGRRATLRRSLSAVGGVTGRGRRAVAAHPALSGALALVVLAVAGVLLWGSLTAPPDGQDSDADAYAAAADPPMGAESSPPADGPSAAPGGAQGDDGWTREADPHEEVGDGAPNSDGTDGEDAGADGDLGGSDPADEADTSTTPSAGEDTSPDRDGTGTGDTDDGSGSEGGDEEPEDDSADCALLQVDVDLLLNLDVCL